MNHFFKKRKIKQQNNLMYLIITLNVRVIKYNRMNFNFLDEKNVLKKCSRNLNEAVANNPLNKIIGRNEEIKRIIEILSRKEKNNPVLVGEPGVGKTAIVEGFVQKIISKEVPDNLSNCLVYEIDLAAIVADTAFHGQFEKRLNTLLKEVKSQAKTIILFIDEIHQIMGMGRNNVNAGMDAANILKPLMARGEIKIIGATTLNEYRNYIEKDGALERRLQKIMVNEPTIEETLMILRGLKEKWEIFHKVRILDKAIVSATKWSERYIPDKFLPDKAIDLIDEAAAKIKTEAHTIPSQLENINKNIFYLETEKIALQKEEENFNNKQRISEIEQKLKNLKQEQSEFKTEWEKQKKQQLQLSQIKNEIEQNIVKTENFQSQGDYVQASKILYSILPQLKKNLSQLEKEISQNKKLLIKDFVSDIDIAAIIARMSKIPIHKIFEKNKDKLNNLKQNLLMQVKGQEYAINIITQTIIKNQVGINNPQKPIGSFLFLGATGVGKTHTAKELAKNLFDSEKAIVRINMSEYSEKNSVARLIGAPPGYIGYEQAGELSEQVRQKPYSVVLLDEIEKAHGDVLHLLLQILDDGILKDNQNRLINFKNTIIIMTSNVGEQLILNNKLNLLEEEIKKHFKSELLNRIDEIIPFNNIEFETANAICDKLL